MADRVEKVTYKVVVDDSDLPDELRPVPKGSAPSAPPTAGTPPPLPDADSPSATSRTQRVQVRRLDDPAHLTSLFAHVMRSPQFSSGVSQSIYSFAQRAGLTSLFNRAAAQAIPGTAAAGAAGATAGGTAAAGGLAAALPIAGLALLVSQTVEKTMREGRQQIFAGQRQMIGATLDADASGIMKGALGAYGGAFHMANIGGMNPAAALGEKLTHAFAGLIDITDKLSEKWSHFSGAIAASEATLRLAQLQANLRMANATSPLIQQYNRLRVQITDITSRLGAAALSMISDLFTPLLRGLNSAVGAIGEALPGIIRWGSIIGTAATAGLFPGVLGQEFANRVEKYKHLNEMSGEIAAAQARRAAAFAMSLPTDILRRTYDKQLRDIVGTTKQHGPIVSTYTATDAQGNKVSVRTHPPSVGSVGGIGIPIPSRVVPSVPHSIVPPSPKPPPPKSPENIPYDPPGAAEERAAKYGQARLDDLRADRKRRSGSIADRESEEEKRILDQQERDLQRQIDQAREKSDRIRQDRVSTAFKSMDFQQFVNVSLTQKIEHERTVHEAIMQIRDHMLRSIGTARNESKLALSMAGLNPGAVG